MKTFAALLLAAALAGCATAPPHHIASQVHVVRKAVREAPAVPVIEPTTPNQIVKHRWYDRFRVHPSKWFHKR